MTNNNPHAVDYRNVRAVIAFARGLARQYPTFVQSVVKYPDRPNYNITTQPDRAAAAGATIVWQSAYHE